MANGENVRVSVTEFGTNIRTTWKQLQIEKDFCDLTLACNDGHVQTHRIIVSQSSPVLKDILKQISNKNPVIYLRGVEYKYLSSLVNFMYQGEVMINDEDLENFLGVAGDLKVTGLSKENGETLNPTDELLENIDGVLTINQNEELLGNMDEEQAKQYSVEHSLQSKHRIQKLTSNDSDSLNLENNSYIKGNLKTVEPELNKEAPYLNNTKHNTQKLVSIKDKKFSCKTCDKQYTDPSNLRKHKASAHEGNRYPCDECKTEPFTLAVNLRRHKVTVHEGVRYPCDQCNAGPFTSSSYLRRHKFSAHQGVRYPCDECNVEPFSQTSHLRRHKASAHEGVRFECNTCDYNATTKEHLKKHCMRVHKFGERNLYYV